MKNLLSSETWLSKETKETDGFVLAIPNNNINKGLQKYNL